jgi:uncharacterized sporulation protein YeaH/YhbH (DUF444 family)
MAHDNGVGLVQEDTGRIDAGDLAEVGDKRRIRTQQRIEYDIDLNIRDAIEAAGIVDVER